MAAGKGERNRKLAKAGCDRIAVLRPEGQVQDCRIGAIVLGQRQRPVEIVGGPNNGVLQFAQPLFRHHGDQRLVIDDQNARHGCSFHGLAFRLDGRKRAA